MSGAGRAGFRLLLRCCPRDYRAAHGEEVLATLCDLAGCGRATGAAEALGVLRLGLTLRLRAARSSPTAQAWAQGADLAGTVALMLLSGLGLTLSARLLLGPFGTAPGTALLAGAGRVETSEILLAGLGWPVALALRMRRHLDSARLAALGATSLAAGVLVHQQLAHRPLPPLDLVGAVTGLATVGLARILSAPSSDRSGLALSGRAWAALVAAATAVVSVATAGRSLGAPGPWLASGPVTGVRASTLVGLLVVGWLLCALLGTAWSSRDPRPLAAAGVLSVVPLLSAVGYSLNSAAFSVHHLVVLLEARAPAVVLVGLLVVTVPVAAQLACRHWPSSTLTARG